jgi:hypothetical protein
VILPLRAAASWVVTGSDIFFSPVFEITEYARNTESFDGKKSVPFSPYVGIIRIRLMGRSWQLPLSPLNGLPRFGAKTYLRIGWL